MLQRLTAVPYTSTSVVAAVELELLIRNSQIRDNLVHQVYIPCSKYRFNRDGKSLLFLTLKISYSRPKMYVCTISGGISTILYFKIVPMSSTRLLYNGNFSRKMLIFYIFG